MTTANWVDTTMDGVAWAKTCGEDRPERPALEGEAEADLVIVGAGFLGTMTALRAAQAGLKVLVLEGGRVASGASGRNGGYVVPHFPGAVSPQMVEGYLGREKGRKLCELVMSGPNRLAEIVKHYQIRSDYLQNGWLQPAHDEVALGKTRAIYEQWKSLGAPVSWLDAGEVAAELGAGGYLGGWRNPEGAVINPMGQSLGFARAAEAEGAVIHEHSRVESIVQDPGQKAVVRGENFRVTAGKVLIATNAYTDDLLPELRKTVIPVRLWHTTTKPLSPELRKTILPNNACFTDLRKSGGFGRLDIEGRLVSGGSCLGVARDAKGYGLAHARARINALYPALRGQPLEFDSYWEGYVAVTDNYLPHMQRLRPDVFSVIGFGTRGVNLAPNLGLLLGDFFGGKLGLADIPLEQVDGVRKIAAHGIKSAVAQQIFPYYKFRDRKSFVV